MKQKSYILSLLLIVCPLVSSCQKENKTARGEKNTINKTLFLNLINAYRTSGCDCGTGGVFAPATYVKWNDTLELAAKQHCLDMLNNGFFDHTGSDGSHCWDRIKRLGYNWTKCGENIGKGYKTEEQVLQGWINSPGHCQNIMDAGFKEIGAAKMGDYCTIVFGAR